MNNITIYFDAFSVSITFIFNSKKIYNLIYTLFLNLIICDKNTLLDRSKYANKQIMITDCENNFFIKYKNELMNVNENALIGILIDFVSDSFELFPPNKFAFYHGSVVSKDDNCVLIIAPTLQGKTTLSTKLTLHGYKYISDDVIIIDKNADLYAFPIPIKLRKSKLFDKDNLSFHYFIKSTSEHLILTNREKSFNCKKYNPQIILFLNKNNDLNNKLTFTKLSNADCINKLIINAATCKNIISHTQISKKLSEKCLIYDIYYNNYQEIMEAFFNQKSLRGCINV